MLYLIRPTAAISWIDLPTHFLDIVVNHEAADLSVLEWKPAEELKFHPTVVRLALRHGVPCKTGIVVKGTDLVPYTWLVDLIQLSQPTHRLQDLPNEDLMEALTPGWKQRSRELDKRVAESMAAKVEQVREELEDELAKPVNQSVVEHWQQLGGRLPDPV